MIKLTYRQFANPQFSMALQKIMQSPLSTHAAYQLKKLGDAFNAARKKMQTEYHDQVLKQFGKLDEKGEVIVGENGQLEIPDERKKEFQDAEEVFFKHEFTLARKKLPLSLFETIKVSAAELGVLDALLEEGPDDMAETPEEAAPSGLKAVQ